MGQPNILFVMTDQQRWDTIGRAGGFCRTPNLDAIAAEGMIFERCFTTSPVCMPARLSLALGKYPHNFGVWQNLPYDLPTNSNTWMQCVRRAGYRTSLFGKSHFHSKSSADLRKTEGLLHAYGFDDVDETVGPRGCQKTLSNMTALWEQRGVWDAFRADYAERFRTKAYLARPSPLPLDLYYDVYVPQQAKRYLAQYQRKEPWACCVSFGGPHEPWDAPEPFASEYEPSSMPPPAPRIHLGSDVPENTLSKRFKWAGTLPTDDVAALRASYAASVTLIDQQIGELWDAVRARGELDNTIFVFSSDHGEMNGDHGIIYKNVFLDGAARVPLIVRTPETRKSPLAGAVLGHLVEWMDIGATLLELAGGRVEHQSFARSLVPVLRDPAQMHREDCLSEFRGEVMLRTDRFKLALNRRGEPYLLVDAPEDPNEQHNLVADRARMSLTIDLKLRILERILGSQSYSPGPDVALPRFALE